MKIKLDENLPARLVAVVAALGHTVDTVPQEDLAGSSDDVVWTAAQEGGRFIITQDLDFSDIRRYLPGTHHGILVVRLREPGRNALLRRVGALSRQERVEQWKGCFVLATERKVRIRQPG